MKKNNSGNKNTKANKVNWFKSQEEKKAETASGSQAGVTIRENKPSSGYKQLEDAPILKMQMNSKKESEHFAAAYAFAQKVSDPSSDEIMTIHLNMKDELVFNIKKDDAYEAQWKSGELMLLVAFPKNWKSIQVSVDADDDEDDEFLDIDSDEDKFDYLYETGMALYEGK